MKRILLIATVALVALGAGAMAAGASKGDPVLNALETARKGTAKYYDVGQALKDGYVQASPCVEAPGLGVMGIHYLNPAYVADPSIKPGKPELLLYIPRPNGKLRLVGVEYFRPDADQDLSTDDDRPFLVGLIPFDGPMEGHDPGMPRHYDLHVWIWADNPFGTFAQFNPTLSCTA